MLQKSFILGGVLLSGLLVSLLASAELHSVSVFGEQYRPLPPVVREQSQIVYYRDKTANSPEPANVYVDGRYHTSLLPGGFTSFCLRPGQHTLGAFVDDPKYRGKTEGRFAAALLGGRTYFLRVDEQQSINQPPVAVLPQQGEQEIVQNRRQIHAYSRAVSLVPCAYDRTATQPQGHYVFRQPAAMFTKTNGEIALTAIGKEAITKLVVTIRQQYPLLHKVTIRLASTHANNLPLQRQEAKALRAALVLAAIPNEVISTQINQCQDVCPESEKGVQILAH